MRISRSVRLRVIACLVAVASVLAAPRLALAQAATGNIAGTVKDSSGAALPGVTVEASSPALIEKTRSVTSNGAGQYAIEDLRPGTYTVTFSLAGFSTVKRDALQLSGSAVATIDIELRLGSLEETVTVTGRAALISSRSVPPTRAWAT